MGSMAERLYTIEYQSGVRWYPALVRYPGSIVVWLFLAECAVCGIILAIVEAL